MRKTTVEAISAPMTLTLVQNSVTRFVVILDATSVRVVLPDPELNIVDVKCCGEAVENSLDLLRVMENQYGVFGPVYGASLNRVRNRPESRANLISVTRDKQNLLLEHCHSSQRLSLHGPPAFRGLFSDSRF
jgi:hypothetical protein